MYVCSRKRRLYHRENRRYARRVAPGNRREFLDEASARDAGYEICRRCGQMNRRHPRALERLKSFCTANRVRRAIFDKAIYPKHRAADGS